MQKKIINDTTSYASKRAVNEYLDELRSQGKNVFWKRAVVNYDTQKGLPKNEEIEKYPLKIFGEDIYSKEEFAIYVYAVTAGCASACSMAIVEILQSCGFFPDETDIISTRKESAGIIKIEYQK